MSVEVGEAIRRIRKTKGLSQAYVADESDVDRGGLSRIERGLQEIPLETLERVAKTLGTSVHEIVRVAEEGQDARLERWERAFRESPQEKIDALLRLLEPDDASDIC